MGGEAKEGKLLRVFGVYQAAEHHPNISARMTHVTSFYVT